MNCDYRLSIVICAIDETYSLRRTYEKLRYYNGASEYLFVLAKTCTDDCLKTVEEICENENCRYIFQPDKGFGDAIRASFEDVNGTHMVVWSADEATDIASFPEMLRLSKENPDKIIKISRWLRKDGFEGYGRIKKMINWVSQRVFGILYHSKLTEFTNPTQIAPVSVYRSIRWERKGFEFLPEMVLKPLKLGIEFIEVPTKNVVREEGRSHNTIKGWLLYYFIIMKIRFTKKEELLKKSIK